MTKQNNAVSLDTIAIQSWLRPALAPVLQNRDYEPLVADLGWLDAALRTNGPEALTREMNKPCIEMTHSRRRAGSKKARKSVLRKMKKLLRGIGEHARRHRDLLDERFAATLLGRTQADRILAVDGKKSGPRRTGGLRADRFIDLLRLLAFAYECRRSPRPEGSGFSKIENPGFIKSR